MQRRVEHFSFPPPPSLFFPPFPPEEKRRRTMEKHRAEQMRPALFYPFSYPPLSPPPSLFFLGSMEGSRQG